MTNNKVTEKRLPETKCGYPNCHKTGAVKITGHLSSHTYSISCGYCFTAWSGYVISAEDAETIKEFVILWKLKPAH